MLRLLLNAINGVRYPYRMSIHPTSIRHIGYWPELDIPAGVSAVLATPSITATEHVLCELSKTETVYSYVIKSVI